MRKPVIAIFHDLTYFGGIESSELDLIKHFYYAGLKVIFAHRSQYYTRYDTINKIAPYVDKVIDIREENIKCDLLIFSSLVFNYWEVEDVFNDRKRIGWIHFIPSKQLGTTMIDDDNFNDTIDRFVCVSEISKNGALKYVDENKIEVIHNTVDVERIKKLAKEKVDLGVDDDTLVLVTVGRISEAKGFNECLKVAEDLESSKIKYKFFFVGGGYGGEYDKRLAEEAKKYNIEIVGYQDNPYKYIARADIGVMLSSEESWCLFNDECWILGVPTLVTQLDAIKERKQWKKYCMMVKHDMSDFSVKNMIKEIPIMKDNLKDYEYENEYYKWRELILNILNN